jgi:hypothetical protein
MLFVTVKMYVQSLTPMFLYYLHADFLLVDLFFIWCEMKYYPLIISQQQSDL